MHGRPSSPILNSLDRLWVRLGLMEPTIGRATHGRESDSALFRIDPDDLRAGVFGPADRLQAHVAAAAEDHDSFRSQRP